MDDAIKRLKPDLLVKKRKEKAKEASCLLYLKWATNIIAA